MTTHSDSEYRFKFHARMCRELTDAGVSGCAYMSEAELVHEYDITFLVGRWDFVEKSREYRPSGTRISTGPYQGQFPTTHSKKTK
jgi:hypothetical protein